MTEDPKEKTVRGEQVPAGKVVTPTPELEDGAANGVAPDGMIAAFAVEPEVKPED